MTVHEAPVGTPYPWKRKLLVVVILIAIGIVAGPFGTYEDLSAFQRGLYWFMVIGGVGFSMELTLNLIFTHQALQRFPHYVKLFVGVLIAAVPGALIVGSAEALVRDNAMNPGFIGNLWFYVSVIGMVVSVVEFGLLSQPRRAARRTGQADSGSAESSEIGTAFLDRLNHELGRNLLSITAEDHYVRVHTELGQQTLLMRLGDAVALLTDWPGVRIHRSHWVSISAIQDLSRQGNNWSVVLVNGQQLPVSRDIGPELKRTLGQSDD